MEAVLSGNGPVHSTAWRGPAWGERDRRLTDFPVRQQHLLSLDPWLHLQPTRVQITIRRRDDSNKKDPLWKRQLRTDVSSTAPTSHPPPSPQIPPESGTQHSKVQIWFPPPPPHLLPIFRLLQWSVHTLTVRCSSELTVYPTPNLKPLQQILWAAKSSAVLLCTVEESNSCKLTHYFSSWWI